MGDTMLGTLFPWNGMRHSSLHGKTCKTPCHSSVHNALMGERELNHSL